MDKEPFGSGLHQLALRYPIGYPQCSSLVGSSSQWFCGTWDLCLWNCPGHFLNYGSRHRLRGGKATAVVLIPLVVGMLLMLVLVALLIGMLMAIGPIQ